MYYLKAVLLENCYYSNNARQLLQKYNFKQEIIDVTQSEKNKWKNNEISTFPQIFLKKENHKDNLFIGGFTDIQFIEIQINSATDKNFSEIKKNIQNKYSHLSEKSVLRLMELFIKNPKRN